MSDRFPCLGHTHGVTHVIPSRSGVLRHAGSGVTTADQLRDRETHDAQDTQRWTDLVRLGRRRPRVRPPQSNGLAGRLSTECLYHRLLPVPQRRKGQWRLVSLEPAFRFSAVRVCGATRQASRLAVPVPSLSPLRSWQETLNANRQNMPGWLCPRQTTWELVLFLLACLLCDASRSVPQRLSVGSPNPV